MSEQTFEDWLRKKREQETKDKHAVGYVYVFYSDDTDIPLYIGSTSNPRERLKAHFCGKDSNGELNRKVLDKVDYFMIARVGNLYEARNTEAYMISYLKPTHNTRMDKYKDSDTVAWSEIKWTKILKRDFIDNKNIVYKACDDENEKFKAQMQSIELQSLKNRVACLEKEIEMATDAIEEIVEFATKLVEKRGVVLQ